MEAKGQDPRGQSIIRCGNRCSEFAGHADPTATSEDSNWRNELAATQELSKKPSMSVKHDGNEEEWMFLESNPGDRKTDYKDGTGRSDQGGSCFDYSQFCRVVNDMELEVFFAQNELPVLDAYPDINTIRDSFIAMNDKLYKRAKERAEARAAAEGSQPPKLRKIYMDAFDHKKRVSQHQKRKIDRGLKMYCRSQAIANLFKSYFSLVDHHHGVFSTYPILKKVYYRAIFAIFGSMQRKYVLVMLGDISSSMKMFVFFRDLYAVWECELDRMERSEILLHI